MPALKTTRPIRPVHTIEDIRAIEAQPYDNQVTARNLYDLLRATAQSCGEKPALTVLRSPDPNDIGVALSHAGLLAAVTKTANLFRGLGLGPTQGVAAFLAPTLPEFPALLLGAQVAGVASTLNYLLNQDAIIDLLNVEQASILVIPAPHLDQTCWDKAQGILGKVPSLRHVLVIGDAELLPEGFTAIAPMLETCSADHLNFEPTQDRDAVCALFHTGGTTGQPKLVPLTHGNQIHAAFGFGQVFGYDETDTVLNGFPFFHVGGTMTVGLSVLAAGGHMIVPSPYALRPPEVMQNYWRLVEAFGATVVSGVPTSIGSMTTTWNPGRNLGSVRMAVTGGAVLPEAIGARFTNLTGIAIHETYGMTETAAAIAFTPGRGTPIAGSVGLRAPYSEIRIVSVDDMSAICATGQSGLVQVRGPQVFPGYTEPGQNVGVLDQGWLSTGDIGYLTNDERLVLTGREKDLIVRSGHNIDPASIENVANAIPGVEISAAVGMPDQYAGEVPILFVVPEKGHPLDLGKLHEQLEAGLDEPPARPRRICLIKALPVTAVGKIFKPALREKAIVEKVNLEIAKVYGGDCQANIFVKTDAQKRTLVDVIVTDPDTVKLAQLRDALAPLPQRYDLSSSCVRLEVREHIATLTLDRPKALNAASETLMRSLELRLREIAAQPDIRAVILTGAGRAFCAGGDLLEFETALNAGGTQLVDTLAYNQQVITMIESLPMPVIGAANGAAVAGGLEMLLCCDIVLAADTARFGDGHAKYGIVPTGGATARLHDRIGPSRAAQLFYTANLVDAATVLDWGLVSEILPSDQLMVRAHTIAQDIAKRSPQVLSEIKKMVTPAAREKPISTRLSAEISHFAKYQNEGDLAEGLRAFREKDTPSFGQKAKPDPDAFKN